MIAVAKALARQASVVLLPMQPPGDLALSERIAAAIPDRGFVIRQPLSPREALAVIARLDGLVAMRLHALIFGAMGGVPLAAIGYDPKIAQLMARLRERDRCVPLAGLDGESVAALMEIEPERRKEMVDELRERAIHMREFALVNVDRALSVAGR